MERNWDLVRDILIEASKADHKTQVLSTQFKNYDPYLVLYHLRMMRDGGLIKIQELSFPQAIPITVAVNSIEWQGHELLDKIKSSKIWEQTKSDAKAKGVDLSFDIIKALATKISLGLLGINS